MTEVHGRSASRGERRRAHTRQKLISAARSLLAGDDAVAGKSVQEITERADVGFGSFYNHFSSKTELFEAALVEVLEEVGAGLDALSEYVDDPAVAFAQSVRLAARLGASSRQTAQILVRHGMDHLGVEAGLAYRAARDIAAGVRSGRFQVTDVPMAVATTGGALLATLQLCLHEPDVEPDDRCDTLAEHLLRMLGLDVGEAAEIARAPLPDVTSPTR